jgi:hypothetical protein
LVSSKITQTTIKKKSKDKIEKKIRQKEKRKKEKKGTSFIMHRHFF